MRVTDATSLDPIVLGANYPAHTYPGGGMSARFRGADPGAAPEPEDWVASVTTRWQEASTISSIRRHIDPHEWMKLFHLVCVWIQSLTLV